MDQSIIERIAQLTRRIDTIPVYEIVIELVLLWAIIYLVFRFLRGTRGARLIKGVVVILIIATLLGKVLTGGTDSFERIGFLTENFLGFASLALVIVFQPELRRGLVRLGEARFLPTGRLRKAKVIEEVIGAVEYLSKNKIGALIAIEREVGLKGIVEAGTRMDASITKELLNTIFWPGSALHDLGVVIQGDRIIAAGVQFPLAEGERFSSSLGSRHRAAIGLSQEADSLVVIVSEETGTISLAERGQLVRNLSTDGLRTQLVRGLGQVELPPDRDSLATEENGSD